MTLSASDESRNVTLISTAHGQEPKQTERLWIDYDARKDSSQRYMSAVRSVATAVLSILSDIEGKAEACRYLRRF